MNRELRQQLLDEAAVRALEHPADLSMALGKGMTMVRRKFLAGSAVALALALALTAAFVAWRLAMVPPPPPALESITVTAAAQELRPTATIPLTATGHYGDGTSKRLLAGVEWASGNTGVATVSSAGVVTAVAKGSAELSATLDGVSGRLTLVVVGGDAATLASLRLDPESARLFPGGVLQLTAEGTFSDGSHGNLNASAQWSSGAPGTATVDGAGRVTAVAPGQTVISAAQEGKRGRATITVLAAPKPEITSLEVAPAQSTLKEGRTVRLDAVARYSDGSSAAVGNATWETLPAGSGIAEVDAAGLVAARRTGSVTVVATVPGAGGQLIQGQAAITVVPSVKSIKVSPAGPLQSEPGGSVQLSAVVLYSDGSTGSDVQWASSRPLIASVDVSGLVTGVKEGDAEITATADGVTGNPVTVLVRTSPD
ncbi:hypothetical protein BIU82_16580 [Arthrobacter sp. SW1]|uniref:Ig-like domain-containing protein n=1 Tax=Arthrobacter sp. SW1 TaxID=1920889 RepID=UPI000877BB64|nr:Ig-like domain-containing protein [Arthrobacter sp. SW1]OFI38920.1 hypothetical protein BIU82_16580 [Arthrobacter sp. SW1]